MDTTKSEIYLDDKEKLIRSMLSQGCSKASICRKLKCHLVTLNNHLERMKEKPCELGDN
jgi:putative DNA-invertase from lambdoid prophage Rac